MHVFSDKFYVLKDAYCRIVPATRKNEEPAG